MLTGVLIVAGVALSVVVVLAIALWSAWDDASELLEERVLLSQANNGLQRTLQQHSETIDANAADMDGMRSKISYHADEIMQLRCANEDLTRERDKLLSRLDETRARVELINAYCNSPVSASAKT